jgi:SLOG-like protein
VAQQAQIAPVFLSASIPDPKRDPKYIGTADVVAIREAVLELCAVVLPHTRLVFGGHPAISPFVRLIADQLGRADRVRIYQSEFFRPNIPPDSQSFPDLVWTPEDPPPPAKATREASLLLMRERMLQSEDFSAGVFIGGMEGVEDEFKLFEQLRPGVPTFLVASTGAAARILFDQNRHRLNPAHADRLERDYVYGALFQSLLGIA